jgi:hypothetical protein
MNLLSKVKNILCKYFCYKEIDAYGSQFWFKNGERHRDNDLPAIIYSDGSKEWYNNGNRIR